MHFNVLVALGLAGGVLAGEQQARDQATNLFDDIVALFTPEVIQQLPQLLVHEPPRRLNATREWGHSTSKEVRGFLPRSLISVCPQAKLDAFECVCSKTYSDVAVVEDRGLDAMVMVAVHKPDKQIVVSYRPTLSVRNWITNLKYQWAPFGTGRVHVGFLNHFKATQASSEAAVVRLLDKYPGHSLLITGYSLGGATGLLSLPSWKQILDDRRDTRNISASLYASPRVGDDAFVDLIHRLGIPVTRYTNNNDLVSHVPPRSFGFVHAGAEVHEYIANGTARLKLCAQDYDEDPKCGWSSANFTSALRHLWPLNNLIPLPQYC